MDDVIKLIAETVTMNANGVQSTTETEREVFATIKSVSRSEWFNAGSQGLQPSFVAVTPMINYNGEKIVKYNTKRYTVYRTYGDGNSDNIELYCQQEVGVTNV